VSEKKATENVLWRPYGGQIDFLSCPVSEVFFGGTRNSGKSDAGLFSFLSQVGKGFGPEWNGLILRRTIPELDDIVRKSYKWFLKLKTPPGYNINKRIWEFPTGETLKFSYIDDIDDYWRYHGHEYAWVLFEELPTWPSLDCYDIMKSVNRCPNTKVPLKYLSNGNPWGPGHNAVKARFIDPAPPKTIIEEEIEAPEIIDGEIVWGKRNSKRVYVPGFFYELTPVFESDPGYVGRITVNSTVDQKKAWAFNDWDITSGGIFDDLWKRSVHIIPSFNIPKNWYVDRSFDWGSEKPFSVGYFAESDGTEVEVPIDYPYPGRVCENGKKRICFPSGTIIRCREIYGWTGEANEGIKFSNRKIAQLIVESDKHFVESELFHFINPGPADNQIRIRNDEESLSIADEMEEEGCIFLFSNKDPGSRVSGVSLMRSRLQAAIEKSSAPMFFTFEECPSFIRTFPSLQRSKLNPDDVDTKQEDHAWDETRYRILNRKMGFSVSYSVM
jgi:hypothetical protein